MVGKFDNLIQTGYNITYNPAEHDAENGITPEIRIQIDKILKKLSKGVKNLNREIELLIAKYPQIPQFKNYLATYYSQNGRHEKAIKINDRILKEHPVYLFGKINLAMQYFYKNQFTKIPEILGEGMEIKSLYPEREIFHIEEVLSFYQIAVYYFIETGNIEAAEMRFKIMFELDKDHIKTTKAGEAITLYNAKKEFEKFKWSDVSPRTPKLISKKNTNKQKQSLYSLTRKLNCCINMAFKLISTL